MINAWKPPKPGTNCPQRLPRCFSSTDMETPNYQATWTAPNQTAMSYVLLLLGKMIATGGLPIWISYDWNDLTITAERRNASV